MEITDLLIFAFNKKASDLHISSNLPPLIRVNGEIKKLNMDPIAPDMALNMVNDIMNDYQKKTLQQNLEVDFSMEINGVSRFRVNAFYTNNGVSAVFRIIPNKITTLEELNAPEIFKKIISSPRGLVLVTGPTGSGKSTTLAAMIDYINEHTEQHILTIEDPIEFVHSSKKCLVNQRELNQSTLSFENALRSAMREDPDVILIGEMRDTETIRLALTAAETGHLVFATLHTTGAAKSIDRIVDIFLGSEKEMIRTMLSESLVSVISQTLVKTADNNGRVAAHEIMISTPAIKNLIRENKVAQMNSTIQTGHSYGMQTLDQSLRTLVQKGIISKDAAMAKAVIPSSIAGL